MHTAFFGQKFKLVTFGNIASLGPSKKIVAHLIGKSNQVKLVERKTPLCDRVRIKVVIIRSK